MKWLLQSLKLDTSVVANMVASQKSFNRMANSAGPYETSRLILTYTVGSSFSFGLQGLKARLRAFLVWCDLVKKIIFLHILHKSIAGRYQPIRGADNGLL